MAEDFTCACEHKIGPNKRRCNQECPSCRIWNGHDKIETADKTPCQCGRENGCGV